MRYSACDFVNDCTENADHYKLLPVPHEVVDGMELPDDPEARTEDDNLRYLAEQVAGCMAAWAEFRAGLQRIRETTTDPKTRNLAHALLEGR